MELDFYLKERLGFVNFFFITASKPFEAIMSSIEKGESPFVPAYDDSGGEPQFLEEWREANTGLESVGNAALSMLSSSLQLFLNDWVCRIEDPNNRYPRTNKRGWFHAYRKALKEVGVDFEGCPSDLKLIEQAVLARNRVQHPDDLTVLRTTHSKSDLKKYPSPFLVSEPDQSTLGFDHDSQTWWVAPNILVDHEKLACVTTEIAAFCSWLEEMYWSTVKK